MWNLTTMDCMNKAAFTAERELTRRLQGEYFALCSAIEREPTSAGFVLFRENPDELRKWVRELVSEGLGVEYPSQDCQLAWSEEFTGFSWSST